MPAWRSCSLSGGFLDVAVADLSLVVQILQRILHRFADAWPPGQPVARRLDHGAVGLGALDGFEAALGLLLVGHAIEQEGVCDSTGAEAGEHDETQS